MIDLIVGVLMPLSTHLYNIMADSFIGGNILPRGSTILRRDTRNFLQQFFFGRQLMMFSLSPLDGTDRVISWVITGYPTAVEILKKNIWIKKCHVVLSKPIVLIYNKRGIIMYNYCLYMRWTSKTVNPREVVFPEGFSSLKNNLSRVDNLMSYEGNKCVIVQKLL